MEKARKSMLLCNLENATPRTRGAIEECLEYPEKESLHEGLNKKLHSSLQSQTRSQLHKTRCTSGPRRLSGRDQHQSASLCGRRETTEICCFRFARTGEIAVKSSCNCSSSHGAELRLVPRYITVPFVFQCLPGMGFVESKSFAFGECLTPVVLQMSGTMDFLHFPRADLHTLYL
jgi:hypothetical protein